MSNMVGANESIPARGKRKVVLDIQGVTVGFMGLAEKDWIDTLPDPPEDIQYRDFVQTAKDINKVQRGGLRRRGRGAQWGLRRLARAATQGSASLAHAPPDTAARRSSESRTASTTLWQ